MEGEIIRLLRIKGLPRCVAKQIAYLNEIDNINIEIDKINEQIAEWVECFNVNNNTDLSAMRIVGNVIMHCGDGSELCLRSDICQLGGNIKMKWVEIQNLALLRTIKKRQYLLAELF